MFIFKSFIDLNLQKKQNSPNRNVFPCQPKKRLVKLEIKIGFIYRCFTPSC